MWCRNVGFQGVWGGAGDVSIRAVTQKYSADEVPTSTSTYPTILLRRHDLTTLGINSEASFSELERIYALKHVSGHYNVNI
jgi:hypothetical protein